MILVFSTYFNVNFFLRLQHSGHLRICYTVHLVVTNLWLQKWQKKKWLVIFTRIPHTFQGGIHRFVKVNSVLSMIKITSSALFYSPYIRWCGSPLSLLSFGNAWTDLSRGNTYLWVTAETISSRMNFLLSLHFSPLCLLSVWLILVSFFSISFLFIILQLTSS